MTIAYLEVYAEAIAHQRRCDPRGLALGGLPWPTCMGEHCRDAARRAGFDQIRRRYAWAIPTEEALQVIAEYSPAGVIELGAGAGYWAMELRARGLDVIALDPDIRGRHGWHTGQLWDTVEIGDHRAASDHRNRTLLLVWPQETWSSEAVAYYPGPTVIYIGQAADRPRQLATPVRTAALPRWAGCADQLEVHQR